MFRTFGAELGKNTQNYNHAGKHGDPIFLLQFLNVLYMAGICAKLEKSLDSKSFLRKLP